MAEIALDLQIEVGRVEKNIGIILGKTAHEIELAVQKGSGQYFPDYEGEYQVTSSLYDVQTLETRNKRMTANMEVRPIPIYTVQNQSGGYTVTIGE